VPGTYGTSGSAPTSAGTSGSGPSSNGVGTGCDDQRCAPHVHVVTADSHSGLPLSGIPPYRGVGALGSFESG
jgi:hypothetical protein